MELQGRMSDLVLNDVSHYPICFLKDQAIALCLWNQKSIICTVKGCGDPKNNRLCLGELPLEASVLPFPCPNLPLGLYPIARLSGSWSCQNLWDREKAIGVPLQCPVNSSLSCTAPPPPSL